MIPSQKGGNMQTMRSKRCPVGHARGDGVPGGIGCQSIPHGIRLPVWAVVVMHICRKVMAAHGTKADSFPTDSIRRC